MGAGKPHLLDLLRFAWPGSPLIPEQGMKGMPLIVNGKGVISMVDLLTQPLIRKLESVDHRIDEVADVERQC